MGVACDMWRRGEAHTWFWWGNSTEGVQSEDLGMKWILIFK